MIADQNTSSRCERCKTIDGCRCLKKHSAIGILAHALGDDRSEAEMARDGAKLVLSQLGKLRRQLEQAERATQHVLLTGKTLPGDDAIWKRVRRAADKLLDGMD